MQVVRTRSEAQAVLAERARPVGLVPTMGALHAGHLALVRAACRDSATVAATIFVNPMQFGPSEDYDRYPRAFEGDVAKLEAAGVDLVFAPDVAEMYPSGFDTVVDPGAIATRFDGALRPGHFRGVATVCMKLFGILGAERAYFGEKDAQQLAMLRHIARDLNLPIEIVAVPTVREQDGLALSSRNAYLTPAERNAAPALYTALRAMVEAVERGERDRDRIAAAGRAKLREPLREAYLDVVDATAFAPVDRLVPGDHIAIGSVWLGTTRLIDNIAFSFSQEQYSTAGANTAA